ncbi:MAG: hypothetical protein NWE89_12325 [Candidatus Bathyarchaeota archaeon]|nr:hypothetical protein [Candidatus Bathyarchaeota archaeon]
MPTAIAEKPIIPLWFQEATLDSKARYIVMCGGTGAGKTWWLPIWLAELIRKHVAEGRGEGARYLVLGPTADMVRDLLVPILLEHYKNTNLEGVYWRQSSIYDLPTGGKIYFRSADKPERIEGHHFLGACVDEPAQMKASIWPVLQARTGFNQAPILFTGYPIAMNWYYHDIYLPWKQGDTVYDFIEFASTDNPLYPKEEYERAKRTLPAWLFDMRYKGKFRKPAGLVYPEFGTHLCVEPFEIEEGWPIYVGLDPGVFFAALFLAEHNKIYYAYSDYYTETVRPADEHVKEIKDRLQGNIPPQYIYDPSRLTDVVDMKLPGLVKANNAVQAGIVSVTKVIKEGRLKIMRGRCPNLMDQMEQYSFPIDPVSGVISKENPIKKFDHLPDCIRYIIHTLEGVKEEKPHIKVF